MEYKGERNYYKLFANFLFKIFLFCKRNYCIIRYYLAIVIVLLRYCITNDEKSVPLEHRNRSEEFIFSLSDFDVY